MSTPYLSVAQVADLWQISPQRIRQYLADGRIAGALKIGPDWLIPIGAKKPENPQERARIAKKPEKTRAKKISK